MHLQQIPLVATLEEAHTALGEANEIVLGFLKLEQIHIEPLVDRPAVEDELVGWDSEQGLGQLSDAFPVEVLQILRGHDEVGFLLAHPLEDVADILNDGGPHRDVVGEPDIELVQHRSGVADGQQAVGHKGQDIEKHGPANAAVGLQETFDPEDNEPG